MRTRLTAQIVAKQEEVKQYELDLEFSRITAPISGRVSRALLTEGNLVNAGGSDQLLTTIVAVDPMYVYFSVDERALQRYMKSRRDAPEMADAPGTLRQRQVPFRFASIPTRASRTRDCLILPTIGSIPRPAPFEFRGVVENRQELSCLARAVRVPRAGDVTNYSVIWCLIRPF